MRDPSAGDARRLFLERVAVITPRSWQHAEGEGTIWGFLEVLVLAPHDPMVVGAGKISTALTSKEDEREKGREGRQGVLS